MRSSGWQTLEGEPMYESGKKQKNIWRSILGAYFSTEKTETIEPTLTVLSVDNALWLMFCTMWFSDSASSMVRRWKVCSIALSSSTNRHRSSTDARVRGFWCETWRFNVVVTSWRIECAYSRPWTNPIQITTANDHSDYIRQQLTYYVFDRSSSATFKSPFRQQFADGVSDC